MGHQRLNVEERRDEEMDLWGAVLDESPESPEYCSLFPRRSEQEKAGVIGD